MIKNYVFLAIACIIVICGAKGQKPEPIYGFAVVTKPLEWYRTQRTLWKQETDKDPKNALAWYYRYKVSRNLLRLDTADTRPNADRKKEHYQLIEDMGKAIPESYEYNLVMYANAGLDSKFLPYLRKAEALGKDRSEHLEFSLIVAELDRNIPLRDSITRQMIRMNVYSPGFMYYGYNAIAGLKPNAIIFTTGDNDTYPLWLLQGQGIRKDITVLNTSLFSITDYRDKICREKGIPFWDKDKRESKLSPDSIADYERDIIPFVAKNFKQGTTYVSLTLQDECYGKILENLYLVGLTYEYSAKDFDNTAVLQYNFEKVYKLDYLQDRFYNDRYQQMVDRCNANYVVPMVKLWEHYHASGEDQKAEVLKKYIVILVKGREDEKQILDLVNH